MLQYYHLVWNINCYSVGMEDDGENYYYTNAALRNFTSPHLIIRWLGLGARGTMNNVEVTVYVEV